MPCAARYRRRSTASPWSSQAVAGSAIRTAVLLVAVDVVGNLVVQRHVVKLRDRQLYAVPRFAAIHGDTETAVVGDGHAVAVSRIDPDIVVIAARQRGQIG